MREERGALHLEVLHAIPGRLRVRLEQPVASALPFERLDGVTSCAYNARIRTLLCTYDAARVSEEALIARMGAVYAGMIGTELLHVKRSEEPGFSLPPTGMLALGFIAVDGALALAGSTLTSVSRWFSTGATIAAVVEHGYQELQVRGSFDPEVMSLVYLINAIGKSNSLQASLLAWAATFGRHIVPRAPREQVYLVRRREQETTLIPVQSPRSGSDYAGAMLRRSAQMLAK